MLEVLRENLTRTHPQTESATFSSQPARTLSPDERHRAVKLAEIIIPGGGKVRRADEKTVAMVEELLEHSAPGMTKLWLKLGDGLDYAAIAFSGSRLTKLSRDRQESLLRRWAIHPVLKAPLHAFATALRMVHFDRTDQYEALGGSLNVVKNIETPRWISQVVGGENAASEHECEVVVVGTGAGGAVVGKELAERGHAVIFVEEGDFLQRDAFNGSSLKAHREFYRGGLSVGNSVFPIFMGRLVGGSTAVNTGSSYRTPDRVLHRWCEETECDDFSPENMARHFERVEEIIQVAPADRRFIGPIQDIFQKGCDAFGWSHFVVPRNAPGCEGTGFCDFGCRTDARRSTNLSYLPPAFERGSELLMRLKATRILMENGRAVGVECIAPKNQNRVRIRAQAVIFSGGALPTPVFLNKLGLCNSSGQLGRNLTVHPSGGVTCLFPDPINGSKYIPQGYGCDEFMDDGMLIAGAQPDYNYGPIVFPLAGSDLMEATNALDYMGSFGFLVSDDARGRVLFGKDGAVTALYNLTRTDVDRMHRALIRCGEIALAAGARRLYPSVLGQAPIETREQFDQFRKARLKAADLMITSYHPLGTAKMGRDPRTSVVDLDNQTHDVKGLYIVDGSNISGPLGVNPQISIMAMATRAAERISAHLG